jgi:hypothetical protein
MRIADPEHCTEVLKNVVDSEQGSRSGFTKPKAKKRRKKKNVLKSWMSSLSLNVLHSGIRRNKLPI